MSDGHALGPRVVEIARGWIGTPYLHQGSCPRVGSDCLGLLRGIWRVLYGCEPDAVPVYTPDWAEPGRDEQLWRGLRAQMREVNGAPQPGEVLLFRMRAGSVAKHLGIASSVGRAPSFVHAYRGHGVVESPLSAPWQRRIVARFQFHEGAR
ncbi:peptidase [Thioclava pacifica]|uniref:Peptidase n=1 Tax=Thioclava pacifica DSM 10166 TaxID=1353537 RepID=A0A074JE49_9RHOB|nr:peptidase [Thioclava pacifica]KEO55931.1 peptidase [Thioclava pacifica DSM 10166]